MAREAARLRCDDHVREYVNVPPCPPPHRHQPVRRCSRRRQFAAAFHPAFRPVGRPPAIAPVQERNRDEVGDCPQRLRISAETAGVLDAALLGNRYNVSRSAAERFRNGGTFHVLVIAGLHISFVAGVLFLVARWLIRQRLFQFLFAGSLLWAYVIAIGFHQPVVRAALMFTLAGFAPIVRRRAHSLNAIGGAALGLLIWRPGDLFDPSFQLTFLSVLAIVSLAVPTLWKMQQTGSWRPTMETPYPPACAGWFRILSEVLFWREREWQAEMARSNVRYRLFKTPVAAKFERWRVQNLLRIAVAAVTVSASVQIGMLPLLIIYFHRLSIASVVLNIFVGGLMAMLALAALVGVLLSQISAWLAAPVIALAEKIDWLMIHMVDPFSSIGLASIRLPHYSGWQAIIYALYYLLLGILVFALARWNPLRPILIFERAGKIVVIPPKANRKTQRLYNKTLYKQRNQIERCFSKLKQFRRFATRFEKNQINFQAVVALACSVLLLA